MSKNKVCKPIMVLLGLAALLTLLFTSCDPKPECECEVKDHLAHGEQCCDLSKCECVAKSYGTVGSVHIYRAIGVDEAAALAAAAIIKGELTAVDITGLTRIIIGDKNQFDSANKVVIINSSSTAQEIRAFFIEDVLTPPLYEINQIPVKKGNGVTNAQMAVAFANLDAGVDGLDEINKDNILEFNIAAEDIDASCVKQGEKWVISMPHNQTNIAALLQGYIEDLISPPPFGVLNALGSEQIPVFMTTGVTNEQMTAFMTNVQLGYDNLNTTNKVALIGKIKEIRVVPASEPNSAIKGSDGKFVITFRENRTNTNIRAAFWSWTENGVIVMAPVSHETVRMVHA